MTGIERNIFMDLNPCGKWLMVLSKFSEIKEMANLMSDEDIKFAETFLRNIQPEVVKNHEKKLARIHEKSRLCVVWLIITACALCDLFQIIANGNTQKHFD